MRDLLRDIGAAAIWVAMFLVLVLVTGLRAAEAPPLAEPGARMVEDVAIRAGLHPGFGRLVFEWPAPIEFEHRESENRLTLRFARPMRADLEPARRHLGEYLTDLRQDESGQTVHLRLGRDVRAQIAAFRPDLVVLDFSPAELQAEELQAHDDAGPAHTDTPPATSGEPEAPPDTVAAASEPDAAGLGELAFEWSRPVAAAVFVRAGHLWAAFDAPPGAATAPFPPPPGPSLEPYLGPGELVDVPDATLVRYPLRRPIPMQVTHEQGTWRVLAMARPSPPEPVPAARVGSPPGLRLEARDGGRVLEAVDPEVGDRLGIWPIRPPGHGQPRARRLVALELLPTLQGVVWRALSDRVHVRAVEGGIEFEAGDGLLLSELVRENEDSGARRAVAADEADARPPEEPALATVTVRAPPPAELEAPLPLGPFPDHPVPPGQASSDPSTDDPGPPDQAMLPEPPAGSAGLGLGAWSLEPDERLIERRTALMDRIQSAPTGDRTETELNLARFFLAQAMAAETLAVLRGMPDDDATSAEPLQVARQGLTGAAEFLMGRLREAAAALKHPGLDDDAETALWRAALAAAENDWARAARELGRSEQTLDGYPPALQLRLGLPAALIALETGDSEFAFSTLARLRALDAHAADQARVAFVEGLAHARVGAIDRADQIWQALEDSPYEETRVKAGYARVTMLLDAGRIGTADALGRLEPARALWRGHAWEPAMLDGLARVQAAANDVGGALRTWQAVVRRYPEATEAARIAPAMRQAFIDALLAENGAEVPPLRALALYRAHPELVPAGAEGDRIRWRLAGRLATLELIEPAAVLLSELVRDRLQGLDKAEAGADLAELWLQEPRAQAALAALEQSEIPQQLAPDLASRRALLRARALAALDRSAEALQLIAGRDDEPARQLRTAIHWQTRNWPELIGEIEPQLTALEPGTPLAEDEQDLVLKLALAHGQLGQTDALRRLRARFGAAMQGQAAEAAFHVATMDGQRAREPAAVLASASRGIGAVRSLLDHGSSSARR